MRNTDYAPKIVAHRLLSLRLKMRSCVCVRLAVLPLLQGTWLHPGSAIPCAPHRELTEPSPTSALAIAYFIVRII